MWREEFPSLARGSDARAAVATSPLCHACIRIRAHFSAAVDACSARQVSTRLLDDKDKLLILATDGVWDVMDNDEAVSVATSAAPSFACADIVEACAKRWDTSMPGRRDDITTVVVDLTHPDCNVGPAVTAAYTDGAPH